MLNYAKRLPPNKPVTLLDNGRVLKKHHTYDEDSFLNLEMMARKQIEEPNPLIVPVYSFISYRNGLKYCYQYEMMRCGLLSKFDRDLVDSIGDAHDRWGSEVFHSGADEVEECLAENPALFNFLVSAIQDLDYRDLHSGNVMLSEDEEYVLIDLEGFW